VAGSRSEDVRPARHGIELVYGNPEAVVLRCEGRGVVKQPRSKIYAFGGEVVEIKPLKFNLEDYLIETLTESRSRGRQSSHPISKRCSMQKLAKTAVTGSDGGQVYDQGYIKDGFFSSFWCSVFSLWSRRTCLRRLLSEAQQKIIVDIGLASISVFGVLLVVLIAAGSYSREREKGYSPTYSPSRSAASISSSAVHRHVDHGSARDVVHDGRVLLHDAAQPDVVSTG